MIKVSIIVPVYNVEKYLARCIDSCINQSLFDIEIICVNDGSTDNSLNILEQYKKLDPRIRIINKENGGLSSARNAGIKEVRGKYILFADSDDFLSSIAAETLYNHAEKNDNDMVIFDYINAEKNKYTCITIMEINKDWLQKNQIFNIETCSEDFYNKIPVPAWCKIYKTDLLKNNNIFFDEGLIFEDVAFFSKVYTKAKRISYIKQPYYFYTSSRPGQIMARHGKELFDIFKIHEIVENEFISSNYYDKYLHALELSLITDIIWKFDIIEPSLKQQFFYRIIDMKSDIDYAFYENSDLPKYTRYAFNKFKIINQLKDFNKYMLLERSNNA